jgi:thioredoxin 1
MKIIMVVAGLAALFFLFFSYMFRRMKNSPDVRKNDKILDLTDKNFLQQIKSNVTLVDFWASWCVPCKMMAPVLNEIAEEVPANVKVCKVNVEEYQSLATKYSVRGIPTMLLFRNGKEIDRFVGVKTKDFLLKRINNLK